MKKQQERETAVPVFRNLGSARAIYPLRVQLPAQWMPRAAFSVTQIIKIRTELGFTIPKVPKLKNLEKLKSYRNNSSAEKLPCRDELEELNLCSPKK